MAKKVWVPKKVRKKLRRANGSRVQRRAGTKSAKIRRKGEQHVRPAVALKRALRAYVQNAEKA